MPPPRRDSASPAPTSRGSRYFSCASSTCSLPFARPRAAGEDVEDQLRAIDDLAADHLLDFAQLRRRQLVVEDDDVDAGFLRGERQRLNLAGAEEGRRIGLRALLQDAQHHFGAGRLGEPRQFVERSLRLETSRPAGDQPHERRPLASPLRSGGP
jgi:hypothetical protein